MSVNGNCPGQFREMFQSLFYWITYSYLVRTLVVYPDVLFQSLFYWITYSYGESVGIKLKKEKVSILILLDYLFLFFTPGREMFEVNRFQSLFYWITYSYSIRHLIPHVCSNVVSILILLDYLFL